MSETPRHRAEGDPAGLTPMGTGDRNRAWLAQHRRSRDAPGTRRPASTRRDRQRGSYSSSGAYGTVLLLGAQQRRRASSQSERHPDGDDQVRSRPAGGHLLVPLQPLLSGRPCLLPGVAAAPGRDRPRAGCAPNIPPARTQLEVRAFQTYTFDTADSKLVMKAMFNALQDEGYVVRNAVIELGLITATREVDLAPGRYTRRDRRRRLRTGRRRRPSPELEVYDFTGNLSELGAAARTASAPAQGPRQPRSGSRLLDRATRCFTGSSSAHQQPCTSTMRVGAKRVPRRHCRRLRST